MSCETEEKRVASNKGNVLLFPRGKNMFLAKQSQARNKLMAKERQVAAKAVNAQGYPEEAIKFSGTIIMLTSLGGQIDASKVDEYATTMFPGDFKRFLAVLHNC